MQEKDLENKYQKLISVAERISDEMSWINANYEILKASKDVQDNFLNTYAGNVWNTLRRTILNEISISIFRILVDEDNQVASLPRLSKLIKNEELLEKVKSRYTQAEGTFDDRIKLLIDLLDELTVEIKDKTSPLRPLVKFRHTRLAHSAQVPYNGSDRLKWGDEKLYIEKLERIIYPMEQVLLNSSNISGSTSSVYKMYAKEFWEGFLIKK